MGDWRDPFRGSCAVSNGLLTRWELRHDFVRVFPDVYVAKGVTIDAAVRARAAAQWSKERAVVAGRSAAALLGVRWIDVDAPAELIVDGPARPPAGILTRRDRVSEDEICAADGLRTTSAARTCFDIGRRLEFEDAVILLDAIGNATRTTPAHITALAQRHTGARNLTALRRAIDHMDPGAESPPETRTRLLLVEHGLPRPQTQLRIRDRSGMMIARADLGWPQWRVLVEYDGIQHWTDRGQRTWDIDRLALLEALGWCVIRVGANLLYTRPWVVVDRVTAALRRAGAPL
ncbi:MAG: DUF559 domain-containing protein [Aldersonia sp.]|nr:DUF559 domain-containing protein [Aldersonia sp.]